MKNKEVVKIIEKIKAIHQINILLTEEMAMKLRYVRQKFFESANKVGKWLAYKLKKERSKSVIYTLKTSEGEEKHREEEIQKITAEFYNHLYRPTKILKEKISVYLKKKPQTKISEEDKKLSEAPFTEQEVTEATKHPQKRPLDQMEFQQNYILK